MYTLSTSLEATALILHDADSTQCWKRSSETVHIDMIASQDLQRICWLHVCDNNLLFHPVSEVLYWIKIQWLWRQLMFSELTVKFKKPTLSLTRRVVLPGRHCQEVVSMWSWRDEHDQQQDLYRPCHSSHIYLSLRRLRNAWKIFPKPWYSDCEQQDGGWMLSSYSFIHLSSSPSSFTRSIPAVIRRGQHYTLRSSAVHNKASHRANYSHSHSHLKSI